MDGVDKGTAHDGLTILGPGAMAFVNTFNQHGGYVRLVAMLSPT